MVNDEKKTSILLLKCNAFIWVLRAIFGDVYWVWFATCNCNKSFVVEANKWVLFSKLSLFMLQLKI